MEESEQSVSIRRELDAIRVMGITLAGLTQPEKDRVMTWLIDKWRVERQAVRMADALPPADVVARGRD